MKTGDKFKVSTDSEQQIYWLGFVDEYSVVVHWKDEQGGIGRREYKIHTAQNYFDNNDWISIKTERRMKLNQILKCIK